MSVLLTPCNPATSETTTAMPTAARRTAPAPHSSPQHQHRYRPRESCCPAPTTRSPVNRTSPSAQHRPSAHQPPQTCPTPTPTPHPYSSPTAVHRHHRQAHRKKHHSPTARRWPCRRPDCSRYPRHRPRPRCHSNRVASCRCEQRSPDPPPTVPPDSPHSPPAAAPPNTGAANNEATVAPNPLLGRSLRRLRRRRRRRAR